LYQAVQFSGWDFLVRPLALSIAAITILSIWLGARKRPGDSATAVNTEGSGEFAQATIL